MRLQLAQAEAELAAQIDRMAGIGVSSTGRRAHKGKGKASGQPSRHAEGRGSTDGTEENEREVTAEEAEVFLGGAGGGVGMVALKVGDGCPFMFYQ